MPIVPRKLPTVADMSAPSAPVPATTGVEEPEKRASRIRPKLMDPPPVDAIAIPPTPTRTDGAVLVKPGSRIRPREPVAAPVPGTAPTPPLDAPPKKGRGHPPVEHRFKKGNSGGPGRPKGSRNHNTIMKERFERKRPLRVDGVQQVATQHEIIVDLRFKQALEGREKSITYLLNEAARLYPSNDDSGHSASVVPPVTRAEQAILDQLFVGMNLPPMIGGHLPPTTGTVAEFLGDADEEDELPENEEDEETKA